MALDVKRLALEGSTPETVIDYLRQVLRDAGPKVTQALVDVISLQAVCFYADIMADHTARLRWAGWDGGDA